MNDTDSSTPFFLNVTLSHPTQNLAADEALALACDDGGPEVLRFWEPDSTFVVAGYANRLEREINLQACRADGIPVLRRISGGGAVVQCQGCLNYTLVLKIPKTGPLTTVSGTNAHIMERMARALSAVGQATVRVQGHTDLSVDGRKISGNSQRRFRNSILFHGCILVRADIAVICRYLNFPSKQPDYRSGRSHEEFVTVFNAPPPAIKQAIIQEWQAASGGADFTDALAAQTQYLVDTKYSLEAWNQKFM